MRNFSIPARTTLLSAFIISLLSGLAYYVVFRGIGGGLNIGLNDPSHGTFPSFIHMAALTWLTLAMMGHRVKDAIQLIMLVLVIAWIGEWLLGHYDTNDLIAALLGTIIAFGTGIFILTSSTKRRNFKPISRSWAAVGLLTCSLVFITGTSPEQDFSGSAKPVYMSYEELRSSVAAESPRELASLGRLYLYKNYIFLNKRNEGIHILDNSDPKNPQNLRFIAIPGNTEISIKENYLYADSYVDLVTLDLNNPENIQEVSRQQDIYPYDEYQNIPEGITFSYSDIDSDKGVVISYVK
jgi:uncharacterized membrane protein